MRFFNVEKKVQPQFSKSSNVLFFKSNLKDSELHAVFQKQLEREQEKTLRVHSVIEKAKPQEYDGWVAQGKCSCGKNTKLYNGKYSVLCRECLELEKLEESKKDTSEEEMF